MAGTVVVLCEETSQLEANAPSSTAIGNALRGVTMQPGHWVGSSPRITRVARVGVGFLTRVAWVWSWDSTHTAAAVRPVLEDWVRAELNAVAPGAWTLTTLHYAEAANGPLAWWASGEAAVTRTRDQFPTGTGRLDPDENAAGPTTPATHPTTPGDVVNTAGRAAQDLSNALVAGSVAVGVVYALTQVIPVLQARRKRRASK